MILNFPFELGQKVYVVKEGYVLDHTEWIPPDYSLGGDADGPFDRGHYEPVYVYNLEVKECSFRFALLDKYKIEDIYSDKESAEWALLNKLAKKKNS